MQREEGFLELRLRSLFQSASLSRMHILRHRSRTTLVWTIGDRVSSIPCPLSFSLFLFSPYTLVYLLSPLWWSLPWDRRAGRTWSTRAKLSAKLRKIVSDTSSYPLWFYPSSRPRRYLRTGSNGTDRLADASRVKGRRPMERGSAPGAYSILSARHWYMAGMGTLHPAWDTTRTWPICARYLGLGISSVLYTLHCENDVRVAFAWRARNQYSYNEEEGGQGSFDEVVFDSGHSLISILMLSGLPTAEVAMSKWRHMNGHCLLFHRGICVY